jgi:predicted DNA-binding transcriptional regulator AlpA
MKKRRRGAAWRAISKSVRVDVCGGGPRERARDVRRQSHEDRGARGPSRAARDNDSPRVPLKQQNRSAAKQTPQVPRATPDLRRPEPKTRRLLTAEAAREAIARGRSTSIFVEKLKRLLPRPDGPHLPTRVAADLNNTQPASSAGRVVDPRYTLPVKPADPPQSPVPTASSATFGVTSESPKSPQTDPHRTGAMIANVVKARATETPLTPNSLSTLLTEKETAARLGLSASTLRNWRSKGQGPPFIRLSARAIRYSRADVDNFLMSRKRRSTSDTGGDNG